MLNLCVGLFLFSSFSVFAQSEAELKIGLMRINYGKGVSLSIDNTSEEDKICSGKVFIKSLRRTLAFPVMQAVPAGVLNVSAYYLPSMDDQIYFVNHDVKCVTAK
jgi:hypothetical protein